jgi:transketolase C-terminal domain/subunit
MKMSWGFARTWWNHSDEFICGKISGKIYRNGCGRTKFSDCCFRYGGDGENSFLYFLCDVFSGRNWEQIRTTIAYNDRPVKIVGSHSGVSVGPDGGTHQAFEDIALMRVLPNMDVVSPCDAIEAKKLRWQLQKLPSQAYLRLVREKTPIITTEETPFDLGKAEIYWLPDVGLAQVGIIVTGGIDV